MSGRAKVIWNLILVSGLAALLSGCSNAQNFQQNSSAKAQISQQLPRDSVKIEGNQVWVEGKELGLIHDSKPKQYEGLPETLPGDISSFEITDLGNGLLFLSGGFAPNKTNPLPQTTNKTFFWSASKKKLEVGPEMSCPRSEHNVTRLPDGRYLITGGKSLTKASTYATAVDILDPKTKSITDGGNLKVDRIGHAILPLSNDSVVVVGGQTYSANSENGSETKSIEIYHTKTKTSEEIGELLKPRQLATILRLNPHQVVVVGGFNSSSERANLPPEVITVPM